MSATVKMEQALEQLRTLEPSVQENALLILSEYDDPKVAEVMLEVLQRIDISQRGSGYMAAQLIHELAKRGESRVVEHIIGLFHHDLEECGDDHQLEVAACDAFRELRANEALPFLRQALFSDRWEYHLEEVAQTLAAIGGTGEEDILLKALESRQSDLQIAALRALRTASTEKSISAIEKAAKSDNDEVRFAAIATLFVLNPAHASENFERMLDAASDYWLKKQVIRLVGEFPVPDMSDRLLPLLAKPDWQMLRFEMLAILV